MSFPFFFSFFFPNVDVRCQTVVLAENEKNKKTKNFWRMEEEKKVHKRRKSERKRPPLIECCWNRNREINLRVWRCTSFFFSEYSIERCEYSVSQLVDDTEEDDEKEEEEVQSSSLKTSHRETTRTSSHHYSVSGSGFGSFLRRRRGLTRDAASTSFPRASSSERFKKWTGRTIARRRRDGRRRRRRIEKPLL